MSTASIWAAPKGSPPRSDIDNIEMLKGPQGTLFGRNTEGGAVSIVTNKPNRQFYLSARVGIGNYGRISASCRAGGGGFEALISRK